MEAQAVCTLFKWCKLTLTAYFLVQSVDYDDKRYNVLLENKDTGDMVATWSSEEDEYVEGRSMYLQVKGDCFHAAEILEGNGKRGSPWAPEDDYYWNRSPYVCNAIDIIKMDDI